MNKNRVPKASPDPLPELAAFLEPFAPLFRRHTSRESMERYLTGLLTDLPHTVSTPEIRVDCPDDVKFQVVEEAKKQLAREHKIIDIDGVRVLFPDGWGLIRASNTQPALVLRFEATSEPALKRIREIVESQVKQYVAGGPARH